MNRLWRQRTFLLSSNPRFGESAFPSSLSNVGRWLFSSLYHNGSSRQKKMVMVCSQQSRSFLCTSSKHQVSNRSNIDVEDILVGDEDENLKEDAPDDLRGMKDISEEQNGGETIASSEAEEVPKAPEVISDPRSVVNALVNFRRVHQTTRRFKKQTRFEAVHFLRSLSIPDKKAPWLNTESAASVLAAAAYFQVQLDTLSLQMAEKYVLQSMQQRNDQTASDEVATITSLVSVISSFFHMKIHLVFVEKHLIPQVLAQVGSLNALDLAITLSTLIRFPKTLSDERIWEIIAASIIEKTEKGYALLDQLLTYFRVTTQLLSVPVFSSSLRNEKSILSFEKKQKLLQLLFPKLCEFIPKMRSYQLGSFVSAMARWYERRPISCILEKEKGEEGKNPVETEIEEISDVLSTLIDRATTSLDRYTAIDLSVVLPGLSRCVRYLQNLNAIYLHESNSALLRSATSNVNKEISSTTRRHTLDEAQQKGLLMLRQNLVDIDTEYDYLLDLCLKKLSFQLPNMDPQQLVMILSGLELSGHLHLASGFLQRVENYICKRHLDFNGHEIAMTLGILFRVNHISNTILLPLLERIHSELVPVLETQELAYILMGYSSYNEESGLYKKLFLKAQRNVLQRMRNSIIKEDDDEISGPKNEMTPSVRLLFAVAFLRYYEPSYDSIENGKGVKSLVLLLQEGIEVPTNNEESSFVAEFLEHAIVSIFASKKSYERLLPASKRLLESQLQKLYSVGSWRQSEQSDASSVKQIEHDKNMLDSSLQSSILGKDSRTLPSLTFLSRLDAPQMVVHAESFVAQLLDAQHTLWRVADLHLLSLFCSSLDTERCLRGELIPFLSAFLHQLNKNQEEQPDDNLSLFSVLYERSFNCLASIQRFSTFVEALRSVLVIFKNTVALGISNEEREDTIDKLEQLVVKRVEILATSAQSVNALDFLELAWTPQLQDVALRILNECQSSGSAAHSLRRILEVMRSMMQRGSKPSVDEQTSSNMKKGTRNTPFFYIDWGKQPTLDVFSCLYRFIQSQVMQTFDTKSVIEVLYLYLHHDDQKGNSNNVTSHSHLKYVPHLIRHCGIHVAERADTTELVELFNLCKFVRSPLTAKTTAILRKILAKDLRQRRAFTCKEQLKNTSEIQAEEEEQRKENEEDGDPVPASSTQSSTTLDAPSYLMKRHHLLTLLEDAPTSPFTTMCVECFLSRLSSSEMASVSYEDESKEDASSGPASLSLFHQDCLSLLHLRLAVSDISAVGHIIEQLLKPPIPTTNDDRRALLPSPLLAEKNVLRDRIVASEILCVFGATLRRQKGRNASWVDSSSFSVSKSFSIVALRQLRLLAQYINVEETFEWLLHSPRHFFSEGFYNTDHVSFWKIDFLRALNYLQFQTKEISSSSVQFFLSPDVVRRFVKDWLSIAVDGSHSDTAKSIGHFLNFVMFEFSSQIIPQDLSAMEKLDLKSKSKKKKKKEGEEGMMIVLASSLFPKMENPQEEGKKQKKSRKEENKSVNASDDDDDMLCKVLSSIIDQFVATIDCADLQDCISVLQLLCLYQKEQLEMNKKIPTSSSKKSQKEPQRALLFTDVDTVDVVLQRVNNVLTGAKPHSLLHLTRLLAASPMANLIKETATDGTVSSIVDLLGSTPISNEGQQKKTKKQKGETDNFAILYRHILARLLMFSRRTLGEFSCEQIEELLGYFQSMERLITVPPEVQTEFQKQLQLLNTEVTEEPALPGEDEL